MRDNLDPEQSDMDQALLRLLTEALASVPTGAATIRQHWDEGGGMWSVEVRPRSASAANLDMGFDGDDLLNVNIGNIWFEVFPVRSVDDLTYAKEIAEAVFAGRLEESGPASEAYGRLLLEDGPVAVGRVHLPWPWKARPLKRRYTPYT
ncbi:hypothetical protein V6K52_07095 [Knoellia sp. S7-12]|uniref:hypothetical protein n=1 Tax=Knoellia sp. S7-12 TaxID=3126698 RepID=UPI003366A58A